MKLYAWQLRRGCFGEHSVFVMAETEESAREHVRQELLRRIGISIDDPDEYYNRIDIDEYELWVNRSDRYILTVAEVGEVLVNSND